MINTQPKNMVGLITENFDAGEMEEFLNLLSNYFRDNVNDLNNMNALAIAQNLKTASQIVGQRTGN